MTHEYKLLRRNTKEALSEEVTKYLADGWDLWGNTFAGGNEEMEFIYQAVVHKIEPASTTRAAEAAGFMTQVPETPADVEAGPTVKVPVLPEMASQPENWLKLHIEFGNNPGSCACFEKVGDNPQCHLHCGGPIPDGHGGLAS